MHWYEIFCDDVIESNHAFMSERKSARVKRGNMRVTLPIVVMMTTTRNPRGKARTTGCDQVKSRYLPPKRQKRLLTVSNIEIEQRETTRG